MKNTLKATAYAAAGTTLLAMNSANTVFANAGSTFGEKNVGIGGEQGEFIATIQGYINTLMTFLSVLAVLLVLFGGFNILTAGGDEEKVKKGKTIIIQAAIGLLVIFLARVLVTWVLSLFTVT
ncbi:MAG: hypothetical protein GY828_08605 [Candidatus Gracilibacteria bacterium]|nr:hypothetical protein [Candidatus Gracilibacteria bacterium]